MAAPPAAALDLGEWIPGLKVHPFLSERTEYETNVFQARSGSQADLIFRTMPGVLAEYAVRPVSLSAGYRVEILNFLTFQNQDIMHHSAAGQAKLELPRLMLSTRENYSFTSDPPNSELTGRIKSTTNTVTPEAEYRLGDRFSVGANYAWTHVDFETVSQLNRDEHSAGGSVFWKFLPKSDMYFSYSYEKKDFSEAVRDVTRNVVVAGLRGELTAKLSSSFRIGYENRESDRNDVKGHHGFILGGDWNFKATERTAISLITDRSVQESVFGNALFFISSIGTVRVEHQFVPKLSANVRLTGGINAYPTKVEVEGQTKFRSDNLWGWGAGVDYTIQPWLRVGVEYSHTRRTSNFNQFNFADDKFSGRITLQF